MSGYYKFHRGVSGLWCMLMALFAAVTLGSCSSQSAPEDARALLATVPSDAGMVCVVDIESLTEDSGLSEKEAASLIKGTVEKDILLRAVTDPASGVRANAAVYFASEGSVLTTCLLDDSEKFRTWLEQTFSAGVETQTAPFWQKSGEAYIHAGSPSCVTVLDKQVWISEGPSPAGEAAVTAYSKLSESRSVIGQEYGKKLAECSDIVEFYAPLAGLMDVAGMSFADRTQIRMVSSMLFENVSAIAGSADLDGRTLKIECSVLNDKGKKARCNLKLGKISVQQVAALGGNADMIFAVSLPHALMQQLIKSSKSLGGSYPAAYEAIMECLDGTVAVAVGAQEGAVGTRRSPLDFPFTASISTRGNQAPLMELFYGLGLKPTTEGNQLLVKNGNYGNGVLTVSAAAEEMDGAALAVASQVNIPAYASAGAPLRPAKMLMTLKGDDKSLELHLEFTPEGESKYFMVNMLGGSSAE